MVDMKVNNSAYKKLQSLEEYAGQELEDKLYAIANDAVRTTLTSTSNKGKIGAVDSGAYLESFSFALGSGRPRRKVYRGNQKSFNPEQLALQNLLSDIKRVDLMSSTRITLRNGSPYASKVEYNYGYRIFAKLRRKHG
jgi:hypothetical protein